MITKSLFAMQKDTVSNADPAFEHQKFESLQLEKNQI